MMTHSGTEESAGTAPAAIRASKMIPILFCASFVPCAKETSDADPIWPQRNVLSWVSFGTLAVTRATVQVPTAATKMARTGAINAGKRTLAITPSHNTPEVPAAARTAPTIPPTSAWEDDDGMPYSQVMRFHTIPPTSPARTTSRVMTLASTIPFAIVAATARERNAPTKFNTADSATAILGRKARVAMDVAMALPVSWKPFVKSKASAVATTRTRSVISFTGSMVPEGVRLANGL